MDKIIRTLICDGQVSLTVLDTRELVNEAIKIHNLSPSAARILGGLLTVCACLSSAMKEDGCISVTVKAKDGDGSVSVSAGRDLHIRGFADGSCEKSLIGGTMQVVREDGRSQPFVGACEITSDDISDILAKYFGQSEQIAAAVCIETDIGADGGCVFAGGVVMQLLPDASESAILKATELFENFQNRNRAGEGEAVDAEKVFNAYFKTYSDGVTTTLFPVYKCNCSEGKIRGVLASVGKTELLKIIDELGEVRVHCHYCNRDYVFGKDYIEENF